MNRQTEVCTCTEDVHMHQLLEGSHALLRCADFVYFGTYQVDFYFYFFLFSANLGCRKPIKTDVGHIFHGFWVGANLLNCLDLFRVQNQFSGASI